MSSAGQPRKLEVRFHGRIIDHLAVQTYQSPVAAIAEMVANAWDADAAEVRVTLPTALGTGALLVVEDDGLGMTLEECQDRYLEVGFNRRGDDPSATSDGGRPLMGRKGIGKFAGFGIANFMTVDTVSRETGERTRFTLSFERLRGDTDEYVNEKPTDVPDVEWWPAGEHDRPAGTRIELTGLKLRQAPAPSVQRRSLARRFLLLERAAEFKVYVDGEPMSAEDEGAEVQFVYPRDYKDGERPDGVKVVEDGWGLEEVAAGQTIRWRVAFYADTIKDEELRGIAVFAHKKLAQRPFFFEIEAKGGTEAQAGQQYLSGAVEADYLDDGADLISIERQRVDWNHHQSEALMRWGERRTRELLRLWGERRKDEKIKLLDKKVEPFAQRLARLPSRERKIVDRAIRNFANIRALTNDQFRTLSEATLTAWENGRLKDLIDDLSHTSDMSENDLVGILLEHQVLTALHTAEAVKAKKRVVQGLRARLELHELENAVRDYIAKDPWLISPKWETFQVERSLSKLVEKAAAEQLDADMLRGRVDLLLSSGEHLLVLEFMRPGLRIDRDHVNRFQGYIDAIRVSLEAQTGQIFKKVTGYIVADRIAEDPVLTKTLQRIAREDMFAKDWATLLDEATAQWREFFDILVERSPDDPRIRALGDDDEGGDDEGGDGVQDDTDGAVADEPASPARAQ